MFPFSLDPGDTSIELPPNTAFVFSPVMDDSGQPLSIIGEDEFISLGYQADSGGGKASLFRRSGLGPNGGVLLKPWPVPTQAGNYTVRRMRTPAYMVNDNDVPDIPSRWAYALVWGALMSYSMRDSDRTHIRAATSKWEFWLRRIRQEESRRAGRAGDERMKPRWGTRDVASSVLTGARYGNLFGGIR